MGESIPAWSWISLILLGSVHGLNPAMGWLFAVSLGIQQRSSKAVIHALGPIVLGHALSIALVAASVLAIGTFLPQDALVVLGGLIMIAFAAWKVYTKFRHKARFGMRVNSRDLIAWSFLMATAHGAGLMLLPALLAMRSSSVPEVAAHASHGHHHHLPETAANGAHGLAVPVAAVGLHTLAMFAVTGIIALVVYKRVGVDILRRAWINIDLIWIGTLALAGLVTLGFGLVALIPG